MKTYLLEIETLTPVGIGSGDKLSPYADVIIDEANKQVHYINHEAVKNRLAAKPELIDDYVNGITGGMDNNRSHFKIKNFIEQRLGLAPQAYIRKSVSGNVKGAKELYTIIKNAGIHPYFPGSSIKGAIKTPLLYNWLIGDHDPKGKESWLSRYLRSIKERSDTVELEKELSDEMEKFQPAISDSSLLPVDGVKIITISRLHLKEGKTTIPQTWETISPKQKASFSLTVKPKEDSADLSWNTIGKSINRFSRHSNERELELLESMGDKINDNQYNKLFDFYEDMNAKIEQAEAEGNKVAYLKLGSSKGYFFNSVGLAVYDADQGDKKLFLSFLKQNGFGKIYNKERKRMEPYKLNPEEFPLTRNIDVATYCPIGWVKITNV